MVEISDKLAMIYSCMFKISLYSIFIISMVSCVNSEQPSTQNSLKAQGPIRLVRGNVDTVKTGEIKRGQGLYQALKSVSIENEMALTMINLLRDEVEFSKLKMGDKLEAVFDINKKLKSFSFSQNEYETHKVSFNKKTGQWDYSLKVKETYWKPRILEGELKPGSSLEQDLIATGLERSVVNEVVNVLLCKVNFRMNARQGDRYSVLLNERKLGDKTVQTQVLYTSYDGIRAGSHKSYYYEDKEKSSTYSAHYTANGQALINSGLRYPLSRLHVRSGYGWRRHPVTGKRAMHRGVDLRARSGAKVHAVAAGKVIVSTYNEFAGNKIAIRHKDKSTSFYYHLSKRSVKVGDWVKTHQIIGKVGATGRVTGAHLHFGFKDTRGRWMNPLNKRMIATPKLTGDRLAQLQGQVSRIEGTLADIQISKEARYLVANLHKIKGRFKEPDLAYFNRDIFIENI